MKNENQHAVSKKEQYNNNIVIDEKTDHKIHEHLSNINDKISDQDIENAAVNFEPTHETQNESKPAIEIGTEEKDQTKKDDKEHDESSVPIITPWNVLGQ